MHISISYRRLQECILKYFFQKRQSISGLDIDSRHVYCTSRADACQDFPSLTPIINHRSVISRLVLREEQTFVGLKKKKKEIRPTLRSQYRSRAEFMSDRESYGKIRREIYVRRRNECKDTGRGRIPELLPMDVAI